MNPQCGKCGQFVSPKTVKFTYGWGDLGEKIDPQPYCMKCFPEGGV